MEIPKQVLKSRIKPISTGNGIAKGSDASPGESDPFSDLQTALQGVLTVVHDSMHEQAPEEWSVELNVGFKGRHTIVPVILSGDAASAMRITARWKKTSGENASADEPLERSVAR